MKIINLEILRETYWGALVQKLSFEFRNSEKSGKTLRSCDNNCRVALFELGERDQKIEWEVFLEKIKIGNYIETLYFI